MSALREDPPGEVIVNIPDGHRMCSDGVIRPVGRLFEPGNNGHGGGRSKGLARQIREMVGDDPTRIATVLFAILEDEHERSSDRIAAAKELFDRGWGKAPAYAPIEGGDPLESSELDKAIRDIADQLIARRHYPVLDQKMHAREIEEGVRPTEGE